MHTFIFRKIALIILIVEEYSRKPTHACIKKELRGAKRLTHVVTKKLSNTKCLESDTYYPQARSLNINIIKYFVATRHAADLFLVVLKS